MKRAIRMRARYLSTLLLALPAFPPPPAAAQCAPVPVAGVAADSVAGVAADRIAPDVRIHARVRAASLRFETQPRGVVRALGCVTGDTVRVLTRTNIPEAVVPGETYRDVEIAIEIVTRLSAVCSPALLDLLRSSTAAPRLAALCAMNSTTGDNRRIP
ncbi:MAG: hypothetical protein ACREK1_07410 [Longimicrobiales bacterium]